MDNITYVPIRTDKCFGPTQLTEVQPELDGRDVRIEIGELPQYQAAPVLIRQVYANLLGNALKFT